MALIDELLAATVPAEILRHVARATWAKTHDGAECPDNRLPSPEALAEWLPECSPEAKAGDLLSEMYGRTAYWDRVRMDGTLTPAAFIEVELRPGVMAVPDGDGGFRPVTLAGIEAVHADWLDLPDPRPRHPLAPLVADWQEHAPVDVEPDRRADTRLLPRQGDLIVTGPHPARDRGARLFGGLLDGRDTAGLGATLPLWPAPAQYRVPLLDLSEAAGAPLRSKGRGAPLDLRLLVRAVLAVRLEDRGRETVRMAVTVGDLLDGLYPRRGARPRRRLAQHWPVIEEALLRLRNYVVPDVAGGRWFVAALRRLPAAQGALPRLDDVVILDVSLPPSWSPDGPPVSLPWLDHAGVTSGPTYRAYIAAQTLLWQPGRTRRPVPGSRWWGWSRSTADYPVLTVDDLRHLAFGRSDTKNRTRAELVAPWKDLLGVRIEPDATDPRTGAVGWCLLSDTTGEPADTTGEPADTTVEPADTTGEREVPEDHL